MAKDQNAKNSLQRLTYVASHAKLLHSWVPKVKTDNRRNITNPECLSNNATGDNQDFTLENCKKTIKTYAMLDNCSQGSFIKEYLLKGLACMV